ncbi:MAG: class I SAM-dependent methyltransferase [Bacteroidales bacterium]|nr:class I SAM-dependent methyltransferase [Bacteroidales bacterium]
MFFYYNFIKYLLTSRHRKGHGIHSPYIYHLIKNVFLYNQKKYQLKLVPRRFKEIIQKYSTVEHLDFGAKGKGTKYLINVKKKYKYISVPIKYGKILSNLITYFNCKNILELGTGLGISSSYMALLNNRSTITTVDASTEFIKIAQELWKKLRINNINVINKTFNEAINEIIKTNDFIDMLFIDGNHKKDALLSYYYKLKPKFNKNTIVVIDDIYWSKEMHEAWNIIKNDPDVSLSIDIFRMGLIFFTDKIFFKQHYKIRY